MKQLEKILSGFENFMLIFGILSGAVVLFINVILRNLGSSLVWAEEYAKFAIIWITFGGCGAAVREKAHMSISAFYDVLKPTGKKVLDIFINVVGLAFSVFMLYYGSMLVQKVLVTNQTSPTMQLPMWIIYISVPIGAALMLLRYGVSLLKCFGVGADKDGKEELE